MKEGTKTVSIIIPVYNSKEGLRDCLDSVVSQDYPNLEVIVVDDCSTDGSLEICREFEQNYEMLTVYTKANEGVSAARNYGLKRATGEYIQFADSDDRLYEGATTKLVDAMERNRSDVVIGGYWNEKDNCQVVPQEGIYEKTEDFSQVFPTLFTGFLIHVPWNKLYRRSILEDVTFPGDLSKGEDLIFNLRVLAKKGTICTLPQVLYFYHNVSDTSLSFRFREDAMDIEERLYREVESYGRQCGIDDFTFLEEFYLTAIKNKCYALMGKSGYDTRQCRQQFKHFCEMESIRELCRKSDKFEKKDQILLFLMKYKMVTLLMWYYQRASKK